MEESASPGSENHFLLAAKWCFPEEKYQMFPVVISAMRSKQMLPLVKIQGKETTGTWHTESTVAVTCLKLHD